MNTRHDLISMKFLYPRIANRIIACVALIGALLLGTAGCGMKPKAVTGNEVSPIQLRTRPRQEDTVRQAETPHTAASSAEPRSVSRVGVQANPARDRVTGEMSPTSRIAASQPRPQDMQTQHPGGADQGQILPPAEFERQALTPAQPPVALVPAASPATVIPPEMADELVQVNFEEVDIRTVLKTIGEITGINFIPHRNVSGTVTVMSPTPIRLGDIYAFLQSILDVAGYAAIETDNAVKIMPKDEAIKRNLQVRIGADPTFIPMNDTMVTQIMPLRFADAGEVGEIVRSLLATGAQMTTYPRTNSIMVTDISANIHHIARIIQQLDVEGSREKVNLFPLQYASAQVLSEQITRILSESQTATVQAGRGRSTAAVETGPQVLPDERTNSLVVVAGEQDMQTITGLVAQLDIQRPTGTDNIHVTYLKNADANDVALSLEAALASMRLTGTMEATPSVKVTPDESTNALIIVSSPQDYEVIAQIIEKLDIVREQVLVEMMILEVTEESLTQIGVDWATLDEAVTDSIRGFAGTNLGPMVSYANGDLEGLAVGAWKDTGDGVSIGAILQALQRESAVNILSTPHIVTTNHRTARIVVGENRPYVISSRITEGYDSLNATNIKSYEYKDVGITLEITPHISQGGLIRLRVDSEFTKLIEDSAAGTPDTPTTAKRNAQTEVTTVSGDTIVIGGLIRDDTSRIENKVPLFGDLPLVGPLFRLQKDVTEKTNLLIFITPHVMTTEQQLREVTAAKRAEMAPLLEERR